MPQEVNMTTDIALWKSEDGLSDDERTIVKRALASSQPQTRWLLAIWCWQFIA